jgi:hypothetical protein
MKKRAYFLSESRPYLYELSPYFLSANKKKRPGKMKLRLLYAIADTNSKSTPISPMTIAPTIWKMKTDRVTEMYTQWFISLYAIVERLETPVWFV